MSVRTLAGLLAVLVAVACTGPEIREPVDVTSAKPPLVFTAAELVVSNPSTLPATAGFRDRQRSERLAVATEGFLRERMQAEGGFGWLQVTIEEAQMLETALPVEGGIRGAFTREPDRLLDALIRVRIAVMGPDGLEQAFTQTEVNRRRPILQNTSVIAVDAEAERLIGDVMSQLDDTLTQTVRQNLNAFLIY